MKKFQPDNKLYSNFYDGYTSSDEFIAKKRVHTTNEIPPVSLYKNLHSMLKTDFWKAFIGDTEIMYDEYYNLDTNGEETFYKEGDVKDTSVAKYTNGIRSVNYGPIPRLIWNPNWERDYKHYLNDVENGLDIEGKTASDFKYIVDNSNTRYNRFEVTGVLQPEKDLIMHEGYRYLSCVYPDHPDYLNILTKNEFDDKIDDSACFIDYDIDIHFMDWLPNYLKYYDGTNFNIAKDDEAAKLKIRNLTNYAYNRKLFGSKEGYKMFASSAYQHASVYSSSKYIPLEGGNISSLEEPKNIDITWYKEFFDQPEEFENSNIDRSHYLYNKLFRNIDWQNSSYDFINRYKEPTPFYGTAYPTPNSRFVLFEYPNERIIDTLDKEEGRGIDDLYGTISSDFKAGQKIKVGGQNGDWEEGTYKEGHISYITGGTLYKVIANLEYKNNNFVASKSNLEEHHIENALTLVEVDTPLQPLYRDFIVYPSNKEILEIISRHDNNSELISHDKDLPIEEKWALHKSDADVMLPYFQALEKEQPFYNSTTALEQIYDENKQELSRFEVLPETRVAKVTLNPSQNGCIFIAPQQQLSEFEEGLNIELNQDEWFTENVRKPASKIIYGTTNISDKAFLKEGDYLISENKKYISSVLGMSNAYLQFSLTDKGTQYSAISKKVASINKEQAAKYGVVFNLSKNNPEAANKKVIVFGKPKFEDVTQMNDDSELFSSKGVYFDVKAIPTTKSHNQLKLIYEAFPEVALKKYESLKTLYKNNYDSISDEYAKTVLNNIKTITLDYEDLDKRINSTNRAIKNKSIYYNNCSVEMFDTLMEKVIDDLAPRNLLKIHARKTYDSFDNSMTDKITNLVRDYRNTYRLELNSLSKKVITNITDSRDIYVVSLNSIYNKFDEVFEKGYDEFYTAISSLVENGTDLEAPKIKENLEKSYTEVREKLNNLAAKINDYTQVYNDSNWTDITSSLNNALQWFERFKDTRNKIKEAYQVMLTKAAEAELNYKNACLESLKEFSEGFSLQYKEYTEALSNSEENVELEKQTLENNFNNASSKFNSVEDDINKRKTLTNEEISDFKEAATAYTDFLIEGYDVDLKITDTKLTAKQFKEQYDKELNEFISFEIAAREAEHGYVAEYFTFYVEEIAIYFDVEQFYKKKINIDDYDADIVEASQNLIECDKVLFTEMLPNKAFLLAPLPNDLLMRETLEGEYSYSLLSDQDEFNYIASFDKNKYEDLLELKKETIFGTKGLLTNCMSINMDAWSFGSINTATLAETHYDDTVFDYVTEDVALKTEEDKNFLGEYYNSSQPWIREYEIEDSQASHLEVKSYKYFDLNHDIYSVMNNTDMAHKFAYCDPNMLELFLDDSEKNNIRGEVINFNKVKVLCKTTQDSKEVYLENLVSIKKLDYIATGDQVIGKTVDDDTYVEAIDIENHVITFTKALQVTGEFIFTFLCKINYEPDDISEDFYNYRIAISKNKEASNDSIFEHGSIDSADYGEVSNFMLSSYLDFAMFREALTDNLQEQPYYRDNFNLLVRNFYNRYLGTARENDVYVKPSMIETENDVFFELNAYNMLDEKYIMRQEILDYFYQYLDELTKASDNIHLGVAINGYTMNDGKITHKDGVYSDSNIHSRFITTDDWKNYEPFYIKIGNGLIPGIFDEKTVEIEDENEESLTRSYYNEHDNPYGSALYSSSEVIKEDNSQAFHYYDIGSPIFKARLGEYEIQKNIIFNDYSSNKTFNTLQFSIMRRMIESFTESNQVIISNATISNWNGLQSWPKNCLAVQTSDEDVYIMGENGSVAELKEISYLGVWSPSVIDDKIVYPEKPIADNIINYYSIINNYEFIVDGEKIMFKAGQILVWEDNSWNIKTFFASGFIGDTTSASNYIIAKNEEESINIGSNLAITENTDLRAVMLYKILNNIGCFTNLSTAVNFGYNKLLELYNFALERQTNDSLETPYDMEYDTLCTKDFNKSTCYWFEYVGYNSEISLELSNRNFNPGQFITALYVNDHFEFYLCDISQLLFHFNNSSKYLSGSEYRTFFGISSAADTNALIEGEYFNRYPFLINEKIESIANTIKLGDYDDLVPGSYSSLNRVCIPYTADGYRYLEDGTISKVKERIFLTEDYIFADEENKKLYTYNVIEGKPVKFAIHQEQNKYFKNIVNNVVKYSKEEKLTKDGLIQNGVFSPVSGFDFNGAEISLNDRILSLKPIDIRSDYNIYFEPRLYSKYTTIKGTLKGIIADCTEENLEEAIYGKVLKWNISNEYAAGTKEYLNRASFAASLNNLRPNNKQNKTVYQEDSLVFNESSFEGKVIAAPKVTKVDVLDKISTENGVTYYKNNLIIEGTIDEKDPTTINFGSTKSIDALKNIQIGDQILEIASLTNGSNTFNQIEVGLSGIRFIDYRNNMFIICADSGMKVRELNEISVESIKSIFYSPIQNYIIDGEDLTGYVVPSMLIWDDDLETWIIGLKQSNSEVGFGMFTISFEENNNISLTKIEGDIEVDHDFDKFQLVNPYISENIYKLNNSSNKLLSHKYGNYRMLARDMSIRTIDEVIEGKPSRATVNVDYNLVDGVITPKSPIYEIEGQLRNYIELNCTVSNTNENTTLKLAANKSYWLFNNKIGKWIYYQTDKGSTIKIGDQDEDSLNIRAYYISLPVAQNVGIDQTFETEAWGFADAANIDDKTQVQGEFLWKLPRPMNEKEIVVVQVETQASYDSTFDTERNGSLVDVYAKIEGATISDISITTKDILNLGTDDKATEEYRLETEIENIPYATGPYVPYDDQTKVIRGCSNAAGYSAVLVGKHVFIKSPTKLWASGNDKHYTPVSQTEELFWKHAKLPRFADISQGDISKMTIDEAYLKVVAMRELILNDLQKNGLDTSFYIWLSKNAVEKYDTIEDIPTKITLKDVTYTITANGIRPTYYISQSEDDVFVPESEMLDGKAIHFENYVAAEDVDLSLGYATDAYLKEQMYLSYLRDFYEIILGCNNTANMFEEGIKDIRMTESCLIITSHNNIIMSLPLEKSTSRDDIENANNWYMTSLNSDYEIPYCDSYSFQNADYIYADNISGVQNYGYGPKLSTFFAYNLTCSYTKDNFQVYGGSLNLDNHAVEDYVNFFKKYNIEQNTEIDYSWMDKSDPTTFADNNLFIAYSSDNGRTFNTVDLVTAGIQMPSSGASVSSIYRIDDVIRVVYLKGENYYYYDILIKDESLEESLIEKSFVVGDKDYHLMNKNFYIGGGYECLINSPVEENNSDDTLTKFIISIPGTFAGGSISSVAETSIKYNPNTSYDVDGALVNVKVLLAIKTSSQIYDQFKYLDYKEDYFNNKYELRVSETTEVANPSSADRAFSLNETLPIAQESIYSIPSFAVDNSPNGTHRIYNYTTSIKPGVKGLIYSPVAMTNFEGNEIYLCGKVSQEEGKRFLLYRNQTIGNSMTFREVLQNYNENPDFVDNVQRMYSVNEEYEFTVNDYALTEILDRYADNKNLILKEINFSSESPNILVITSENTDSDIETIFDKGYFLKWPTIDGELQTQLCGPLGLEFEEYDNEDSDYGLKEFLEKLQILEGELGNLSDDMISNYFKPIKVFYKEDEYFYGVYEVKSSTILMTERVIKEAVSMSYEFGSSFKYLDNSTLTSTSNLDGHNLDTYTSVLDTQYDENSPINAIEIDPVGYGSSISNTKWDCKLPQDIDPAAWKENTLLFNSNKEPIFLCDANGNNISMRKGLFYLEKGNEYKVAYDNLYAKDSVIDIFDGNLIDNKSEFHFYNLPESDIKVWTPFEKIDLTEKDITLFRVYRGGTLIDEEEFNANYSLKYSPLYKKDLTPYIGLAISYDGNKLSFNEDYLGDAVVENDVLTVEIIDNRSGKSVSVDLRVDNCFKIVNTPETYYAYTGDESTSTTFEIKGFISKVSIPDNNISGSLSYNSITDTTSITFIISRLPEKQSIIIYDSKGNSENLNIDIAKLSPVLYLDRYWEGGELTVDSINCRVYSEDVDITDRYIITKNEGLITASCTESAFSVLTKSISHFDTSIKAGDIEYNNKFVYSYGESNILTVSRQKDFLVRGLFGQVILLAPAFRNFKELISSLGRMIDSDVDEIYNVNTADEKISIVSVTNSAINIDHLLDTTAPYLRIKLLPISSILISADLMNNKEYYTEISTEDIDFFGYDRVFINENVFMAPPLKVNDQYFNADSVSQYTVEPWKNKDNYSVYLTDEEGKYVRGFIAGHELKYKTIGDEFGNCSKEIYQTMDPRLNPTELIYKTAYEYYYNNFYSITKKSNPFFRFLKIGQNIVGENIFDEINIYQQRKENNKIVLKKDDKFTVINNVMMDLDLCETYKIDDVVDEKQGELNYTITCSPSEKEYNYLAGIKYKDYMYDSDIVSNKKYCRVDSDLIANFTILSKEDLTNKKYEPVIDVTEVGIFSKEGYLLAYMHHPAVQYNTKKNHLSYNLIIENE